MRYFSTPIEAIEDLKKRGYVNDLNLQPHCIVSPEHDLELHPEDFTIDEFYRFEGMTNPSDSSIVYAISAKDGFKGILTDAYGVYAESLTPEMVKKMQVKHSN